MELETCIKYLDYVSAECDRHLRDGKVSDDELVNFIIELDHFKEQCQESDLPEELKIKISEIKMNYTVEGVERGSWYLFAAIVSLGSWVALILLRQQSRRKQILNEIKFDCSRLSSFIKLHY